MRRIFPALALVVAFAGCGSGAREVPLGFSPETAATVGARDVWILGDGNVLIRSTDAGAHFERVAFPSFMPRGVVPEIQFVTAQVGYAYGPGGDLYVTRDGGTHWFGDGGVNAFALGGRFAYTITGGGRLVRSSLAGRSTKVMPERVPSQYVSIAVRGDHVWLLGPPRTSPDFDTIMISSDLGRTFTKHPGPCFAELGGRLVPAGGNVVWAVCPTGSMAELLRSTDGGRSFGIASFHDPGGTKQPGLTNGAEIVPLSPSAAILDGGGEGPLLRTIDGGKRWTTLRLPFRIAQLDWIDFTSASDGLVLVQTHQNGTPAELWRTTDGGVTWHRVAGIP